MVRALRPGRAFQHPVLVMQRDHDPKDIPLSLRLPVEEVDASPQPFSWRATAEERAALKAWLGIEDVLDAAFDGTLRRRSDGRSIELVLNLKAKLLQKCVITLEPVQTQVDETIRLVYTPEADASPGCDELDIDPLAEDPPEVLEEGGIDVGRLGCEYLSLALDPYPRKPGAKVTYDEDGSGAVEEEHPFAALERLKRRN